MSTTTRSKTDGAHGIILSRLARGAGGTRAARAVFLDRDGTLIHDRPGFYLRRPEQVRIYPFTAQALRLLRRAGFRLVIVSNQSGIGRGFLDLKMLARVHRRLLAGLRQGGAGLDGIYFCPHAPKDRCRCRKPSPLLARKAAREMRLSIPSSFVIGDKKVDADLAKALGIPCVQVATGHGKEQRRLYGRRLAAAHLSGTLLSAARWIIHRTGAAVLLLAAALPPSFAQDPSTAPAAAPPPALAAESAPAASTGPLAGEPALGRTAGGLSAADGHSKLRMDWEGAATPESLIKPIPAGPEFSKVPWFPESLEFDVKWGILAVGHATMASEQTVELAGQPAFRIVSEARSNGFCDGFYKVRDHNESWIHPSSKRSLGYLKRLREGNFFRDEWVLFDYGRNAFYAKRLDKDGALSTSTGTIPGDVMDILSSLYYIRPHKLEVGSEVTLDVNDKSNWPLVITVTGREKVSVPAGKFSTVIVEPHLRREGIFVQKGKRLRVWLTDDERHMPVLMRVEVFFGHISTYLRKIVRAP
ncbi:MAG: HAD-IIIA family hydrolase [Elusimicrobiota bacterium]